MLVHFHVTHRSVLVLQPALERTFSPAEEAQLVKPRTRVPECAAEKVHSKRNVVAIDFWILNGLGNLFCQFGSECLIGVDEQNPVVCERKIVQRPLPFLRPPTGVMKL